MSRLLHADCWRMYRGKWFWLSLGSMLLMSVAFIIMQYTIMDYTVPLSRVIFLPLSFYGVVTAVLVSMFVGQDFSDGVIRNKIIAGRGRYSVYAANLIISWSACVIIYLTSAFFAVAMGRFYFEADITSVEYLQHLLLGISMCLAYGSIYCTITMLSGNKSVAIVLCMGLSFFMLFACLHTNQVMVQPEYKDGILNPAYVTGFKKVIYAVLHDLNPFGQAAQLSAMKVFHPIRWILCDCIWMVAAGVGSVFFQRKNVR